MAEKLILFGVLIAVIWASAFAQSLPARAQLQVEVRPEFQIQWNDQSTLLIKARLQPENAAQIWASDTCDTAPVLARTINASGAHALPLAIIDNGSKAYICVSAGNFHTHFAIHAAR